MSYFFTEGKRGKKIFHLFISRDRYSSQPFQNSRQAYSCTPVDSTSLDAFGPTIACALKFASMKTNEAYEPGSHRLSSPTYVKVSAPLLYKPLPRTSSLVYIAPPIVKSASAVVATEPKSLEKDAQNMVNDTKIENKSRIK